MRDKESWSCERGVREALSESGTEANGKAADGGVSRRSFLQSAATTVAAAGLVADGGGVAGGQQAGGRAGGDAIEGAEKDRVTLPQLHAASEVPEKTPGPFVNPARRVGFAIVGLGTLSMNQILPAFGKCLHARPVALVRGDRGKALKVADQYGIRGGSVYDYAGYERLRENPEVEVIYIVLPNSMHAEFVVRGARAGKHILCEKPMATNVRDCEQMMAACERAKVKLMIAYRQQYEPMNRALVRMVREGRLGRLRTMIATNAQNQGDPGQWRQKLALSGGGCLPDVGIYCLNAARFISGEEPVEVSGMTFQPKDDPRFAEVEATCTFEARFPSGLLAIANSGYAVHRSQFLRVEGEAGWAELSPAFGYTGLRLRTSAVVDGLDVVSELSIEARDQFATEMDHMARCVLANVEPHTGGREGMQDQRLVEAIYESARSGRAVKVGAPVEPVRGPEPEEKA